MNSHTFYVHTFAREVSQTTSWVMNHESSQFAVGYTVPSDKYCSLLQQLFVDWLFNDRSGWLNRCSSCKVKIQWRFFWFQTLRFRVTEFRFICWLVEMRWVGTFKPHLILSNLLIVVIQLTFMEFSSWHPIKTPLILIRPIRTYRICHSIAQISDDRRTVAVDSDGEQETNPSLDHLKVPKPSWTLRISVDTVF